MAPVRASWVLRCRPEVSKTKTREASLSAIAMLATPSGTGAVTRRIEGGVAWVRMTSLFGATARPDCPGRRTLNCAWVACWLLNVGGEDDKGAPASVVTSPLVASTR